MKLKKVFIVGRKLKKSLVYITIIAVFFISCQRNIKTENITFFGLGTVLNIIYTGDKNEEVEKKLKNDVFEIENDFSFYKKDSYVSKLNEDAFKKNVEVPNHVCELIDYALKIGKDTEGLFDITYKSQSILWEKGIVPEENLVSEKRKLSGYNKVSVDCTKNIVRYENEGVVIDLGGIAKGYAIDRAGDILKKHGIVDFIVNYGGDMLVCGKKGKEEWKIGIKNPDNPENILEMLRVGDDSCIGIATSGDYERFILINNKRYSHIFDPRKGKPVENAKSVTVLGKNATIADVSATAVSVAINEEELIKKIMEKFDVKIYTLNGYDLKWIER